ncbi:hypothetical protein OROMI_034544 [Orobanche minor]
MRIKIYQMARTIFTATKKMTREQVVDEQIDKYWAYFYNGTMKITTFISILLMKWERLDEGSGWHYSYPRGMEAHIRIARANQRLGITHIRRYG